MIGEMECVSPTSQITDDDLTLGLMSRDKYSKGKYTES